MAFETVCKASLLYEGELVPCMVGDKEIVIMWADGGKPKAYEARCPHEDVSLGRGDFNGRILYCIAHGWVFDGRTGQGLQPTGCAMKEYPMRIENGMVLVDVAA
ncbi:(2Fe-2S)-binding protein [Halothiobacillus diazotrophicus]|uniref:(2Fe-2S)-binding protein n=1 Tax=Halothiobacillus diazotrophicus TaxID=1860122 RepID=A0A191ZEC2_9GAMM|nr:Rieske 2Fe-2S domain-containing protein [Halothiobacillus diazotrophicus]ANJ66218.1 (2Fe-2S)-binding protein [Halothiobacillus diazotrophicus]